MKSSKVALWNLIKWPFKTDYINDHLLTTYLLFDENVVDDDSEDESNEEEEDSDKIVDDPLDDFDTKWNEFQYIVTEKTIRAFCQKFTDRGRTSSQVVYFAFIACKEETKTATEVFSWWGCDQQSAWCQITLIVILKFISWYGGIIYEF